MKRLPSRNKLAARPVPDVAAPLGTPAKAVPQWREWRLSPWAALAAVLSVTVVLLCEPSGLAGWLKAFAAAVIVPGGAYATVKTATGQWRVE